jgi:2-oxoglutarate dehydrogenase E2 component (dihydrolipoamide succinyltransferase)
MSQSELIMPKMGESIMEATILKWLKKEGDTVAIDEAVLEIATDKVDSEVPSPFEGTITQLLYKEGDVVEVGKPIAIISGEGGGETIVTAPAMEETRREEPVRQQPVQQEVHRESAPVAAHSGSNTEPNRFYSPLVMNIARQEGVGMAELENIPGTGKDNRVTKSDILEYVRNRTNGTSAAPVKEISAPVSNTAVQKTGSAAPPVQEQRQSAAVVNSNVEIVEMDRMRKLIADHMVMSKHTSPHVTSFVEVDMTNIVGWRNRVKKRFEEKEGQKITFTPIFIEAVVKAIKEFPGINVSLDGYNILYKKDINIGMAAALPSGNLIVPVIKNADRMNLVGLTANVNDLANRARENKLKPEEIQGGTFTLTNVGSFGSIMGTPVINQPQVAILAVGAIKKRPMVLETEQGDVIAIRHMMYMSMSYDHRIVDGMMGGTFLNRVAQLLEGFDPNREI